MADEWRKRSTERERSAAVAEARADAAAVRARCTRLSGFVRESWKHLPELANEVYVHGWHIDLICAHLEAITFGQLIGMGRENRLLINIPPGMMKSLLVSVFWPAWEWANGFAHHQYICTSFALTNCTRDTVRMRDLVSSEWYQSLYGKDWTEKGDDGENIPRRGITLVYKGELHISNTVGGSRRGVPFLSLTQWRGHRVIIDDPHSVEKAESDADRGRVTYNFRNSVTSRLIDPKTSAIVVVMQRLHVSDVSGVIEELRLPYCHLMLPMKLEVDRRCVTPIGKDPRRVEGELIFPQRSTAEIVARDEATMTDSAIAGQYQQRPYLRIGAMFQRGWFKPVRAVPADALRCRGWDLAASKKKKNSAAGGPAYTAGIRMSAVAPSPRQVSFYIEHAVRLRGRPAEVETTIKSTAASDPPNTRISIPQDPGQAGVAQRDAYAALLVGRDVRFSPESGEKEDRANPLAAQAEVGNVYIVATGDSARDAWIEPFLDEICLFPGGRFKDQTDASSRAFAELMTLLKMASVGGDIGGPPLQVDRGSGVPPPADLAERGVDPEYGD